MSPGLTGLITNIGTIEFANSGMRAKVDLNDRLKSYKMFHVRHGDNSGIEDIFSEFDNHWFD